MYEGIFSLNAQALLCCCKCLVIKYKDIHLILTLSLFLFFHTICLSLLLLHMCVYEICLLSPACVILLLCNVGCYIWLLLFLQIFHSFHFEWWQWKCFIEIYCLLFLLMARKLNLCRFFHISYKRQQIRRYMGMEQDVIWKVKLLH